MRKIANALDDAAFFMTVVLRGGLLIACLYGAALVHFAPH